MVATLDELLDVFETFQTIFSEAFRGGEVGFDRLEFTQQSVTVGLESFSEGRGSACDVFCIIPDSCGCAADGVSNLLLDPLCTVCSLLLYVLHTGKCSIGCVLHVMHVLLCDVSRPVHSLRRSVFHTVHKAASPLPDLGAVELVESVTHVSPLLLVVQSIS